jgi:predicted DCC family thiol-disulfide oxidoreductase YuxK
VFLCDLCGYQELQLPKVSPTPNPILLYDGVCGLCNRLVQFVINRDPQNRFRFAALQSDYARTLLQKHGIDPRQLETMCLVRDHGQPSERIETRSTAALGIFRQLGIFWRTLANLLALIPRPLRDWGYNAVARSRYRIFGKHNTCPLPGEKHRDKFLDQ